MPSFLRTRNFGFISRIQRSGAQWIIDQFPWMTPNLMCAGRIAGAITMGVLLCILAWSDATHSTILFWTRAIITIAALLVGLVAWYTDLFDGTVATIQAEMGWPLPSKPEEDGMGWWQLFTRPGYTHFGKVIDPWADKAMFAFAGIPLSIIAGFKAMMAVAIGLEVALVLVRVWKEHVLNVRDNSANVFGKIKSNVQPYSLLIIFLATLVPYIGSAVNMVISTKSLCFTLMALVVITQIGSLGGHVFTGLRKRWGYDKLDAA